MFSKYSLALWISFVIMKGVLLADPWGKDADLVPFKRDSDQQQSCCNPPEVNRPLVSIGVLLIKFHQDVISPADGPRSHFYPSSSQYMLDAMRRYGFFWGFARGCDRLMRENDDPWIYPTIINPEGRLLKWDPVRD